MRCVILDVDEKNFNEVKIVYYFIGRETNKSNDVFCMSNTMLCIFYLGMPNLNYN